MYKFTKFAIPPHLVICELHAYFTFDTELLLIPLAKFLLVRHICKYHRPAAPSTATILVRCCDQLAEGVSRCKMFGVGFLFQRRPSPRQGPTPDPCPTPNPCMEVRPRLGQDSMILFPLQWQVGNDSCFCESLSTDLGLRRIISSLVIPGLSYWLLTNKDFISRY